MLRSRFLGKVFLGGNKYISCHNYVLLDAYCCHFLHSFYIVVSSLFRGGIVPWPHPEKNQRKIQREDLFLEITMFLG